MDRGKWAATIPVTMVLVAVTVASAQTKQELHFKVHHKASISVVNQYGPISVKPSANKEVTVTAILHSDKVEIDQHQSGNRINLVSHLLPGADADSGRVDYELLVPASANVTLHSATGPLHAEKLHGDVILEGNTANVDVRDLNSGHIHVKR